MSEVLTSTRNPRVRAAAALARRRERRTRGLHLVEGPRALGEAVAAGALREVFVAEDRLELVAALPRELAVTVVADHVLDHLADARTPQGVVGVAATPAADLTALADTRFVLVLDRLADPGNVGTVLRTADAAGADAVVATLGSADPFGPKAIRAAVGSTYHLPVVSDVEPDALASALHAGGHQLLGLDARAERRVDELARGDAPLTLVLGSEAHGLGEGIPLDGRVRIAMASRTESLNVAAAAAVAAFTVASRLGTIELG